MSHPKTGENGRNRENLVAIDVSEGRFVILRFVISRFVTAATSVGVITGEIFAVIAGILVTIVRVLVIATQLFKCLFPCDILRASLDLFSSSVMSLALAT